LIKFVRRLLRRLNTEEAFFVRQIREISGYTPDEISLYKLALTHSSLVKEGGNSAKECNERLEYLGDAILGAVIAEFLYKKYPLKDEGFLTEMRSKMVNRSMLNEVAIRLHLDSLVQHDFKNQSAKNQSLYGNALEAFIGALYLDKGYLKTRKFIYSRLISENIKLNDLEVLDENYKSKLLQHVQKMKLAPISYELVSEEGSGHRKMYTIAVKIGDMEYGKASDFRKKIAEQKASEMALQKLEKQNNEE